MPRTERRTDAQAPDLGPPSLLDLYRDERNALVRLAALLLQQRSDAEDVVQDAFVRAYLRWDSLRDPESALPFLRSAVLNGARSKLRRRRVAARFRQTAAADSDSAETHAVREAERRHLVASLAALPARQRECLVLRYYLGLSEQETASTLGISEGSVKTHLHRGSGRLAARLEGLP